MNFGAAEVVVFLIGQVVVGAAIWGGIRAKIESFHFRLDSLERRFDSHMALNDTWHGIERRRS